MKRPCPLTSWTPRLAWSVKVTPDATKQIEKLGSENAGRIRDYLSERLSKLDDPRMRGKRLKGSKLANFWRYRVGKTAVCRQVADGLHEGLHQVRCVSFSTGSVRDTCNAIATAFGLEESQSRATLFRALRAETSRLVGEAGKLPVLILDEAHHLGNDVLAEFKTLANHRMDSENRLCLLLVGLTELRNRLRMAVHEPLAQRIAVNCHIPALRHEAVGACVGHRMRLAGADVPVFEPAAVEALAPSRVPRKIDRLAHHALTAADVPVFEPAAVEALAPSRVPRKIDRLAHHALTAAAADGKRTVTDGHVNRAADEVVP